MDATLLGRQHLLLTASLLLLSSLLLGILYKGNAQGLEIPTPLDGQFPDVLSRKRLYSTNARQLLEKYYEEVSQSRFRGSATMFS